MIVGMKKLYNGSRVMLCPWIHLRDSHYECTEFTAEHGNLKFSLAWSNFFHRQQEKRERSYIGMRLISSPMTCTPTHIILILLVENPN